MYNILLFIFCVVASSILNRARGSQLYGLTSSTTIGRLVSMAGIAAVATLSLMPHTLESAALVFIISWALLFFWCVWAWDALWGATIQGDARLTGLAWFTLRMMLILPFYIFMVYMNGNWMHLAFASTSLLMAGVYYVMGYVFPQPDARVIWVSEMTVGALIGATIFLIGL